MRKQWQQLSICVGTDRSITIFNTPMQCKEEILNACLMETLTLNLIGELGWELVAVVGDEYHYKRPVEK